jgi:hypothetical protein
MSARELLRVGFILLGAFLIVSALESLVESLNQRPAVMVSGEQPVPDLLRSVWVLAAFSTAASLVFGVVPGILLITQSERWAHRVLPESRSSVSSPASVLLPVGLMLLGLLMGIHGLAGVVGGIASQVAQRSAEPERYAYAFSWQLLSSGLVQLVAGALVFAWGRQSALNAA